MSGSPTLDAGREHFWEGVQSALDERRDPLADERLRAWALEHPEDALELADLQASLRETERADNPLRAPRRSRLVPLAAAAGLALLAGAAWIVLRPHAPAAPVLTAAQELELHPVVPAPSLGSVQSWEVVSSCTTSEGTITVRATEGLVETENEFALRTCAVAQVEAPTIHEESWRHE